VALTGTSRGTGTHNTGATTSVPGGRSATLAVGSIGVLCIALDNAGTSGSTLISPASWTDAKGNVWTRRTNRLYDNGAASAGIEMVFYTAPITVALLTTDAGTITWSPAASPVAKVWTWYEVIPSANAEVAYSTGGDIAGATAANAQVTTASVLVGDAVIAGYFSENVAAVTGDSDSTNGTWTAQQTATVGTTTSGVRIATQQKVQTTAASTQSYDVTVASQDCIAGYIMLHEQHTGSASLVSSGGGVVALPANKQGLRAVVATGGGVTTAAITAAHNGTQTSTGGGTAIFAAVAAEFHFGAVVVSGGGIITSATSTDRPSTVTATGAGVASLSITSARLGAALLSGGGLVTFTGTGGSGEGDGVVTTTGVAATSAAPAVHRPAGAALVVGPAHVRLSPARRGRVQASGGGSVTMTGIAWDDDEDALLLLIGAA